MEIVVFRSDIARLVLGYIKNEKLDKAARIFCKTSPHLTEEFSAYKQGFQGYSFFPDLEEIICEFVKITQKVDEVLRQLPEDLRIHLQFKKLSDKVTELLNIVVQRLLSESNKSKIVERPKISNSEVKTGDTLLSAKENHKSSSPTKRKRDESLTSASDEQRSEFKHKKYRKRRRLYEPFCFLGGKRLDILKKVAKPPINSDDNSTLSENDDDHSQEERTDDAEQVESEDHLSVCDISNLEKPTKESTPRNKFSNSNYQTPTVPELSQAILDNTEFQTKLVENINEALQSATKSTECPKDAAEMEQNLNTNQLLDEMVKNILAVTEKDPAFDAIIEEVVGSQKAHVVDTAVQCNIPYQLRDENTNTAVEQGPQLPVNSITNENILNIANIPPPRTPLIIRNAVAASHGVANNNDAQSLPILPANTSFGSLIDPNFSISKLIVLNSNDSAQKQYPDNSGGIGNITADNLLNQLNNPTSENTLDEQVHLDVATGQLTFPIFLTNDGYLTNLPFLINNEMITQQLQADNISNLDSSRIEISLPEPIIVSADQLPPNSKISDSTKKANDGESAADVSVNNPEKTVTKQKPNAVTTVPSSLDSRLHTERATPSSCGIVNAKAYKSLSTPRKRASHVRTLTFSPKSLTAHALNGIATPLSTRRETMKALKQIPKSIPEEGKENAGISEKAVIKNIEILPRISGANAIDISANESSNSSNVPPLFANEESSNQTVIKFDNTSTKSKTQTAATKTKKMNAATVETPKRKQVRKNAVRACKRQLSKSPNEDIVKNDAGEKAIGANENQENQISLTNKNNKSKSVESKEKDKNSSVDLMEEWIRMRSCSSNNLDSRLREINASKGFTKTVKKVTKKKVRRRKDAAKKAKEKQASLEAAEIFEDEKLLSTDEAQNESQTTSEHEVLNSDKLINIVLTQSDDKVDSLAKETEHKDKEKDKDKDNDKDKKKTAKEKPKEFNIKIITPQKSREKKIEASVMKSNKKMEPSENKTLNALTRKELSKPAIIGNIGVCPRKESVELEKRTANIACLLETPFKETNSQDESFVPPTPGIFAHSLGTPVSKITPSIEEMHTASFLFGSLTKSELGTPMLSAITPGFKFTPFGSNDATPRSVAATEYSSGSSYYRPDESEDLDKNIEKMLKNSAQKNSTNSTQQNSTTESDVAAEFVPEEAINECTTETRSGVCVKIPAATLKVEPIVLKRVKSFGSEAVDGIEAPVIAKVEPHYTLVSGLPELSAVEDECSSSSSGSSSTSSSSSSSSSDSSSTSSSKSSASETPANKVGTDAKKKDTKLTLSLEQLSEISSAEDEEWQKLVVTDGEDSQLVSNDGEVRYPVRSWLTPSKEQNIEEAHTTITVTLPLMSAEKRNRQLVELEEKRERLKEKLKGDVNRQQKKEKPVQCPPATKAAMAATRSMQAMHKTNKPNTAAAAQSNSPNAPQESKKALQPKVVEEPRTLDVLTALNLSAKKPVITINTQKTTSDTVSKEKHVKINVTSKKDASDNKTTTRRKSQMIEARPPTKPKIRVTAVPRAPNRLKSLRNTRASGDAKNTEHSEEQVVATLKTKASPETAKSKKPISVRLPKPSTKKASPSKSSQTKVMAKTNSKKKSIQETTTKEETPEESGEPTEKAAENEACAATKPVEATVETTSNVITNETGGDDTRKEPEAEKPVDTKVVATEVAESTNPNESANVVAPREASEDDIPDELSDECVLTTAAENEANCIQIISDESTAPNLPPSNERPFNNISNFVMSLEIEGQGTHTLRVNEDICLFSATPTPAPNANVKVTQAIKNIPKKRRIRLLTNEDSDSGSIKTLDKAKATSTPLVQKKPADVLQAALEDSNNKEAITSTATASSTNTNTNIETTASTAATDKIKIDDIETILSQLHGT